MKRFFTVAFFPALLFCFQPVFAAGNISGKVVETMNSGGYTYVCLEKGGVKTWVAVPEIKVTKGQQMSFYPGAEMTDFESKTLKRTFKQIVFSAGPMPQGSKNESKKEDKTSGRDKAVSAKVNTKIEKAKGPNSYTIAEVYEKKDKLNNQKIAVRGKVIKTLTGIMKRNWLHIQDGSGSAGKGNYELVVTTGEIPPAEGTIVTVSGNFIKNRDFGSGYKYDAIIENAAIKK